MAVAGTINARLPEDLKRRGGQVLAREGVSTTQAVRCLYEYLEREQRVPEWMRGDAGACDEVSKRREKLRSLVGVVDVPRGVDARQEYRDYLVEKHGPGLRS